MFILSIVQTVAEENLEFLEIIPHFGLAGSNQDRFLLEDFHETENRILEGFQDTALTLGPEANLIRS